MRFHFMNQQSQLFPHSSVPAAAQFGFTAFFDEAFSLLPSFASARVRLHPLLHGQPTRSPLAAVWIDSRSMQQLRSSEARSNRNSLLVRVQLSG